MDLHDTGLEWMRRDDEDGVTFAVHCFSLALGRVKRAEHAAPILYNVALCHARQGKWFEAIEMTHRARSATVDALVQSVSEQDGAAPLSREAAELRLADQFQAQHDAALRHFYGQAGLGEHVLDSGDAGVQYDVATRLRKQGNCNTAVDFHLLRVLARDPMSAKAHFWLGKTRELSKGDPVDIVARFRRALELDPSDLRPLGALIGYSLATGTWDGLEERMSSAVAVLHERLMTYGDRWPLGLSAVLPPLQLITYANVHPRATRAALRLSSANFVVDMDPASVFEHDLPSKALQLAGPGGRRLRLAFVSEALTCHIVGKMSQRLWELLDASRFESFCYMYGLDTSIDCDVGERIRRSCDHFVVVRDLTQADAAARIQADGIDVLIDMDGLTGQSRPIILARRPAPVQMHFGGFPGTTGAEALDYFYGDPVATPAVAASTAFSEKLVLSHLYQLNHQADVHAELVRGDRSALLNGTSASPDAVVFGSLQRLEKVDPATFDMWMAILRRVPGSILWLYPPARPDSIERVKAEAERRGVDPDRVLLVTGARSEASHMARLSLLDVFLDTPRYNAMSTMADALWAGVPPVVLQGDAFHMAHRVSSALLSALGCPQLVVDSRSAYVELAVRMGTDATFRSEARACVEHGKRHGRTFDGRAWAREFEQSVEAMFEIAAAGLAPRHVFI